MSTKTFQEVDRAALRNFVNLVWLSMKLFVDKRSYHKQDYIIIASYRFLCECVTASRSQLRICVVFREFSLAPLKAVMHLAVSDPWPLPWPLCRLLLSEKNKSCEHQNCIETIITLLCCHAATLHCSAHTTFAHFASHKFADHGVSLTIYMYLNKLNWHFWHILHLHSLQ